jgi:hypothetical protein
VYAVLAALVIVSMLTTAAHADLFPRESNAPRECRDRPADRPCTSAEYVWYKDHHDPDHRVAIGLGAGGIVLLCGIWFVYRRRRGKAS